MTSSILDADVKELCIHVMKKVIEKTQKDENESISKNAVYEKACATSNGIGAFDSSNITNPDEIKITDIGKNYPEYLNT